jgi:hypothetical protein
VLDELPGLVPESDEPPDVDVSDFDGPSGLTEKSEEPPVVEVREPDGFPGLIEVSKEPGKFVVFGDVTGFDGMVGV